jgi:uncharacterized protein YodC (DUF2158 family)
MSIKQGDVVILKSGSAEMTVNRWIPSTTDIELCWFDYNEKEIKTQIVNVETVKHVENSAY